MTKRPGIRTDPGASVGLIGQRPAVIVACGAALLSSLSLLRPLSFDELYWLTIVRRMIGAGDLPYFDLLDNKGPLLYPIVAAADLLPGNERIGFTILLAIAATILGLTSLCVARASGKTGMWPIYSALLTVGVGLILGGWTVTVGFLGAAMLIAAFAARRPWPRIALIVVAAAIDPRALIFGAVEVTLRWRETKLNRVHVSAFFAVVAAGVGLVLASEPMRYAIVESSLATRYGSDSLSLVLMTVMSVSPVVLVAWLGRRSRPMPARPLIFLALAAFLGLGAGLPIAHYWTYVVLAIPLIPMTGRHPAVTVVGLTAAVLTVQLIAVIPHIEHDRDQSATNDPVGRTIAELVEPEDQVLVWSSHPHLRYRIAGQTLGFAPSSNYFAWGLPHPARLLDRLERDLEMATVVVVQFGLEPYRGDPTMAVALDLVARAVAESDCSVDLNGTILYRFGSC